MAAQRNLRLHDAARHGGSFGLLLTHGRRATTQNGGSPPFLGRQSYWKNFSQWFLLSFGFSSLNLLIVHETHFEEGSPAVAPARACLARVWCLPSSSCRAGFTRVCPARRHAPALRVCGVSLVQSRLHTCVPGSQFSCSHHLPLSPPGVLSACSSLVFVCFCPFSVQLSRLRVL